MSSFPDSIGTGMPRNSPVDASLSPHGQESSSTIHQVAGMDLSNIERVRGSITKGLTAFVATAWDTHEARADEAAEEKKRKSYSRGRGGALQRSSPSKDRVDLTSTHAGDDIAVRFAASVMPAGRRHVQPLPEILETGRGFQPLPSTAGQHQHEHHHHQQQQQQQQQQFLTTSTTPQKNHFSCSTNLAADSEDGDLSFTSTTQSNSAVISSSHQRHRHHHHQSQGPSPIPNDPHRQPQQQQHSGGQSPPSAGGGGGVSNRLYSTKTLRHSLNELQQKPTASSPAAVSMKSGGRRPSARRAASSGAHTSARGRAVGVAAKVTCCPEDMARNTGHLASGIVIGSCERQAMQRATTLQRELELEQEGRATDQWKHELELVKLLNKSQALEKEVERLTAVVENPKPLKDAQMLRGEFESRWKKAQLRVEELEQAAVKWEEEREEIKLQVMKKDHEIEGLRAAVKRMESTDSSHEDVLAVARKKWFEEKKLREEAEAAAEELRQKNAQLEKRGVAYRSAIRGLEGKLVVNHRRDKTIKSPSPRPSSRDQQQYPPIATTPVGAARNAVRGGGGGGGGTGTPHRRSETPGGGGGGGGLTTSDLDNAVRTLVGIYGDSPRGGPLGHQ